MRLYSVSKVIRNARRKAGLTQEEASEGICSVQMLSRLETGRTDVSYGIFAALMRRLGEREVQFSPAFTDRQEYEFYRDMRYLWICLNAWQLDAVYEGLNKLAGSRWLEEPLYRQEWIYLFCRLQFCSCRYSHQQNYDSLLHGLQLTRPGIELQNIRSLLLTRNEFHILIALAQQAIYLKKTEEALLLHSQLHRLLIASSLSVRERERLQAEEAIVYTKCLIALEKFDEALDAAEGVRHRMAGCNETAQLLELTFLTGLCCLRTGNLEMADFHIKAAFYTAQALDSCYAVPWVRYLEAETDYPLCGRMRLLLGAPMKEYPIMEFRNVTGQVKKEEGKREFSFTIGDWIRELRKEQSISQQTLCQGLCSKSKLSKIENGSQDPEIMLASALLERLGVADGLFTYYGDAASVKFAQLLYKIRHRYAESEEILEGWMDEMAELAGKKGVVYYQEYLLEKALQLECAEEEITMLREALHLTLPGFDIHKICDYRLSWCELTILNSIALAYRSTEEAYLCTVYYSQILAYARAADLDLLTRINILPFTYYGYVRTLYLRELYQEALSVAEEADRFLMKIQDGACANYLFFYAQLLAEHERFEEAHTQALLACGLQNILEHPTNAKILQKSFLEDFSIELEY